MRMKGKPGKTRLRKANLHKADAALQQAEAMPADKRARAVCRPGKRPADPRPPASDKQASYEWALKGAHSM